MCPYELRNEKTGGDPSWYKSWPYAFRANIDNKYRYFYLPISPQNLNITTHFATNVVATLYSTVEEHSTVRYYDITIQGTTGFVPTFTKEQGSPEMSITKSSTRSSYGTKEIVPQGGFGFFKKTVNLINTIKNQAQDVLKPKNHEAGVFLDNNGYVAFHNFYRFLIKHKTFAAKSASKANIDGQPNILTFLNYKDNNQYDCVVKSFVLERNAENPMLYNYSIQLRGYNLSTVDSSSVSSDLSDRYSELGLTQDKKSIAANVMKKVSSAKNALNAARSLIGNIGK